MPDKKSVVHGRDNKLREDFFNFLRCLKLNPMEWSEAIRLTCFAKAWKQIWIKM